MFPQFDQLQKFAQESMDATMASLGAFSKGSQTIASESADFARKAFEQSTGTFEKLTGARSIETAAQIQGDFVKGAFEGLVAQSSRMGQLCTTLAKETAKPFEPLVRKPFSA
jgi:hypothetical protein